MRIAQIAPVWFTVPPQGYGGIETVVGQLADGLIDRGHDVTLFASGGSRSKARVVSPVEDPPGLNWPDAVEEEIFHALASYERAGEFDVIHDHSYVGPALAAQRTTGPPVVHTLHGPWTDLSRRRYGVIGRRVHLVAISETQRSGNDEARYAGTVHNGVDTDAFPYREDKEDFLLFVGRAAPEKGPNVAVEVAKRAGRHLKLVVRREEPAQQEYWERAVVPKLSGDEELFEELGHDDKADLLSRAAGVLFPINWPEPFGLVMVEAMACGTPVVALRCGAAVEIIEPDVTGFLCRSEDEMVEAVGALDRIKPPDCRARAEERFSAEKMVLGYERIFERLIGADGGPRGSSSG